MTNSVKIFLYSFLLILFARCDNSIIYNNEISDQSSTEIKDNNNNKNFISPNNESYSFLALGDSYTVGEGVSYEESWPSQFVDYALDRGIDFKEGDYFSYGTYFFEATSIIYDKLIFIEIPRSCCIYIC